MNEKIPILSNCWCGGQLMNSMHPAYSICQDCGTFILKNRPTKEQLKKFYSFDEYWHDYQTSVSGYPNIEQRAIDDFGNRIPVWYQILRGYKPKFKTLLEIGCTHGGFLSYCHTRGVQNVVGVEPDEKTCEFARRKFKLPHVISGLFPDVSLPFEKFDVIVGFDVIEHMLDPLEAVQKIASLLEDDGICFLQLPCYRGEKREWIQFRTDEHVFLYNSQSICRLFNRAGLRVVNTRPGHYSDDIFIIGHKKL